MRSAWVHLLAFTPTLAVDDSTILLSVSRAGAKVGAEQRLVDAAAQQNVTQLASFIEEMAEVDLQGDGVTDDLKTAITLIRENVLSTIVTGLRSEHERDQDLVDDLGSCMDKCNGDLQGAVEADRALMMNSYQAKRTHEECRKQVRSHYVEKILKCEELDAWIAGLKWPKGQDQECVWGNPEDIVGQKFRDSIEWYTTRYFQWMDRHKACVAAVKAYDEVDADCDYKQMLFEVSSCSVVAGMESSCKDTHLPCCARCADNFHKTVDEVECREKDRKIDYSAVQKIECYLDILMTSPSDAQIKEQCTKDQCTASDWRLAQYASCHVKCENVDFDAEGYIVIDGVNTTHRHGEEVAETRCTREFDVNFPAMGLCAGCPDPPFGPCSESWLETHYLKFQSTRHTSGIEEGTKFCPCSGLHDIPIPAGAPYDDGECPTSHEEWHSYSLAQCRSCPESPKPTDPCDFFGDEVLIMVTDQILEIGEVIVRGPNGVQVPLQATMSSSHQSKFYYAGRCTDGDATTQCRAVGLTSEQWLSLKMEKPQCVSSVEVHNVEAPCGACADGIVGAHISLVNRGLLVWRSTFDHKQLVWKWDMADIDHTLIAEFPLDADCNSPHGGLQGTAPEGWAFVPGIKSNALSLKNDQFCVVEELKDRYWGAGLSACAWIRSPSNHQLDATIIGIGGHAAGSWEISLSSAGLGGRVVTENDNTPTDLDVQGVQVLGNQWHHVCMTFNGHQVNLYTDKELVRSADQEPGPIVGDNMPFFISNMFGKFEGQIDQVRLYRRTLTMADISMVYELDAAQPAGLVAPPPPSCPSGVGATRTVDNRCYFVHSEHSLNINTGRTWCQSHGGELASIHTAAANNAVLELLTNSDGSRVSAWIGALRTNSVNAQQQGTWTWEDGSAWDTISWATDGLNHNGGGLWETRICIHSDQRWHDWTHGTDPKGVVCQVNLAAIPF